MRVRKAAALLGVLLLAAMTVTAEAAWPGGGRTLILADMDGGDGGDTNIDLAVRKVTVQPVRAYVGDVVHIEVLIENRFEGKQTTPARVYANGKEIGSRLFTWGMGGDRLHHLSFDWDTRGVSPGKYKIKATALVFEDSSSSDNEMDVSQPVVLAAPGSVFPGGEQAGGSYTETDPRFERNKIQ